MHFKLLIALVEDSKTNDVLVAARDAGATGVTVLNQARGEGLVRHKTFFGMNLETQRNMLLFLVEKHLSRQILEHIAEIGEFDETSGSGIVFQLDVEDVFGVTQQIRSLTDVVEDKL